MSAESVKCRCGWSIRKKGASWQHIGAGTVACPPQSMWADPSKFVPNAKGQPEGVRCRHCGEAITPAVRGTEGFYHVATGNRRCDGAAEGSGLGGRHSLLAAAVELCPICLTPYPPEVEHFPCEPVPEEVYREAVRAGLVPASLAYDPGDDV